VQIHPTAYVAPNAKLGSNVSVGAFSLIHADVVIGDNTIIESHCVIGNPSALSAGAPLIIGRDSLIRSHSIFYVGSTFGDRLVTGHRVTVREGTKAGTNLQIGTLSDVQGHCEIGDYVRTHSNVHIGQKSKIGSFVWIFPYVVLTNDPHPPSNVMMGCIIEDYAVIATMSVVLPGVKVGTHALVAAHSLVSKDVESRTVVGGSPAKYICHSEKIKLKDGTDAPAYPWPSHFTRGYPDEVVAEWRIGFEQQRGPR
jgi:acetyltransferase-like isoleucine patch superfamily enzyme